MIDSSEPDSVQTERTRTPAARMLIGDRGNHFLNQVQGETGINVSACYQCERCTNACPVSAYMDIKPHQTIRYVQLGWRDKLLRSSTLWVCLSCEMCSTYCPNEVAVVHVISYLRNTAFHSAIPPKERHLAVFHQTFLEEMQRLGRVNEVWLMSAFNRKPNILRDKLKSGLLKDELKLGYALWRRGKLPIWPKKSKSIKEIQKFYQRRMGGIFR